MEVRPPKLVRVDAELSMEAIDTIYADCCGAAGSAEMTINISITDSYDGFTPMELSLRVFVAALLLWGPAVASPPSSEPVSSVHPELWPAAVPPSADPATEAWVQQLLAQLSLEEKVGQMIQADIASISPAELRTYRLGSNLAGGNAAPGGNVHSTPQAWLDLTDAFYRASLTATVAAHPPIPILFGIDLSESLN